METSSGDYSTDAMVQDLKAVIASHGDPEPVLIGAERLEPSCGFARSVTVTVGHDHQGSIFGQALSDRATDTPCSAGNQRDLSCKWFHQMDLNAEGLYAPTLEAALARQGEVSTPCSGIRNLVDDALELA